MKIVKINENILTEMAYYRTDAIEKCYSLGKRFIEHFHKIYTNPKDINVHHWAKEMQAWYDYMKNIVIKQTKRRLNNSQRKDWFYSFGSSYEEFFNEDREEIEYYEIFIDLLDSSDDVEQSIYDLNL